MCIYFKDLLFIILLTSSVWIVSEVKKFIENGFSLFPAKRSVKTAKSFLDFDV